MASKAKLNFLRELGADDALDYADSARLSESGAYDLIIDNMGGQVGLNALNLLAENGRLVTIPTVTAADIKAKAGSLNKQALGLTVRFDAAQLNELAEKIAEEKIRLHIDKTYLLHEASLAHKDIEQGRTTGKRVLLIP